MTLQPRPYQEEGLQALHRHLIEKTSNPCLVIPTGGGKSPMMAWAIQRFQKMAPWFRGCILAHRKELIEQNRDELQAICPDLKIGIFAASMKRKDYESEILIASIDSIYQRSGEFRPWDALFIDEAHRIPFSGEGKYRTFIRGSQRFNSRMRTIGWTATPFRMNGGELCHKDHILNEICYEAKLTDLIRDGYLSNLRTKIGEAQPLLDSVRKQRGDYVMADLAGITNNEKMVNEAVTEIIRLITYEARQSVLVFCVDIAHCTMVANAFEKHGIKAPFVTAKTKAEDREKIVKQFKAGKLLVVLNVNVYTEGFNAPNVDCIVLLRPTLSPGLYSQMVGRGLRIPNNVASNLPGRDVSAVAIHAETCSQKVDCLVLDFASCIDEHGPIDLLGGERTVLAVCYNCRESFSRAIRICPACGTELPKAEIERAAAEEMNKRLHGKKASQKAILSGVPMTLKVDQVMCSRHKKEGSPDSLRIQYRCGMDMYHEWVCLNHPGEIRFKAQQWYRERLGGSPKNHVSVGDALSYMFLNSDLKTWTQTITVVKIGKYWKIVDYNKPISEQSYEE